MCSCRGLPEILVVDDEIFGNPLGEIISDNASSDFLLTLRSVEAVNLSTP